MHQFSDKTDNFEFLGPNLPKNEFWGWKFGLNLGKLPNYVQYFGSNIVEGVAESWVEAEMSWMEVGGAGWRWVHGLVIPIKESLRKQVINAWNRKIVKKILKFGTTNT